MLIQRYHDRHAWVLALLFGGFIAGVDLPNLLPVIHPILRKPLLPIGGLSRSSRRGARPFFASFPEPTPLDRKVPWLKGVLLGLPLVVAALLAGRRLASAWVVGLVRLRVPAPGLLSNSRSGSTALLDTGWVWPRSCGIRLALGRRPGGAPA